MTATAELPYVKSRNLGLPSSLITKRVVWLAACCSLIESFVWLFEAFVKTGLTAAGRDLSIADTRCKQVIYRFRTISVLN